MKNRNGVQIPDSLQCRAEISLIAVGVGGRHRDVNV